MQSEDGIDKDCRNLCFEWFESKIPITNGISTVMFFKSAPRPYDDILESQTHISPWEIK